MLRAAGTAGTLLRVSKRAAGDRERGRSGKNSLPHGHLHGISDAVNSGAQACLIKLKFGQRLQPRNVDKGTFIARAGADRDHIMPSSRGSQSDSPGQ
jgi:hypothetical protein